MLDFAEQTGSGIVIVVWSFLQVIELSKYIIIAMQNSQANRDALEVLHVP
jgi:hypothetical protein